MNQPIVTNQRQPQLINGIDVSALQSIGAAVTEQPSRALASFSTRTRWTGGLAARSEVKQWSLGGQSLPRDFSIESDEPGELLGGGSAPNPQELLFSAIAACMIVTWVVGAASQGIELEELSIELSGTLDLRGPMGLVRELRRGFPGVKCRVEVSAKTGAEELRALHEQVLANSANVEHLTQAVPLHTELIVAGEP